MVKLVQVFSDDSYVCPDCGDRFDADDGYYIESRDESICLIGGP